jgi:DNA primase
MPPGEDPDSFLRKNGRTEFEDRVTNARNFFDVWLDRDPKAVDLDSLGQKMQLARHLGDTVSRIRDPIMRREVSNRVSARIGVPVNDFEKMLTPARRSDSAGRPTERKVEQTFEQPRHEVATLCMLALRDGNARSYLLEQEWPQVLGETANSGMLHRILSAEINPDEPATLNRFMSTLNASEEALVSEWLFQKLPPNPAKVAQDWWMGLRQATVRRQLQIAEGRMRIPNLSAGEITALQKQILDLREQLGQLAQLSSAHVFEA